MPALPGFTNLMSHLYFQFIHSFHHTTGDFSYWIGDRIMVRIYPGFVLVFFTSMWNHPSGNAYNGTICGNVFNNDGISAYPDLVT